MNDAGMILSGLLAIVGLALSIAYSDQPPLARLQTSPAAIALIKEREGLRLEAYQDVGGRWTIGYGHAGDVDPDMRIDLRKAERLLHQDIARIERFIKKRIKTEVNQNEFSALVSLAYNIGTGALSNSTVFNALNDGDRETAAEAFLMWTKIRIDGELVDSVYLARYRGEERDLFLR